MNKTDWLEKRFVEVNGRRMAWVETGTGDPIVFQHGNPTSSWLWREVMPHLAGYGRCIAVDLIGMGDSDKLPDSGPGSYRLAEQADYLYACWEALGIRDRVTLVLHDWGSMLGFDWARRHPQAVAGIAYMEAILRPWDSMDQWRRSVEAPALGAAFDPDAPGMFDLLRSPAGDAFCLQDNGFVEQLLPGFVLGDIAPEAMQEYRRPFLRAGEDRRPTLTWPREMPIAGEPADVVATSQACADFLATTDIPKLFIRCEPGALIRDEHLAFARSLPRQEEVSVPGLHFAQEDCPDAIGQAIADWYARRIARG